MSDHVRYLGHTAHPVKITPANRWRAVCSCGWTGLNQPYKSMAMQDAIDHVLGEENSGRE